MTLAPVLALICGAVLGAGLTVLALWLIRRISRAHETTSPDRVPAAGKNGEPRRKFWRVTWLRSVARRVVLIGGPVAVNGLYASIATAQGVLRHVDPLVFTAVQMALLLPVSALMLFFSRRIRQPARIRQGLIAGVLLGVGFLCMALALRSIGIVPSAMLTALDGILASLISWLILRQRQSLSTCLAAVCAGCGAFFLWRVAPGHWQADLVALGCGLLFTVSTLYIEHNGVTCGSIRQLWPFWGALFAAMSGVTLALALCFGIWPTLGTMTSSDLGILVYASVGATLLPVLLLTLLQRVLSAVTVAFLAVLEPLVSIGFASALGSLALTLIGWWGVALILLSVLLQARAAARVNASTSEDHAVVREAEELVREAGAVTATAEG